MKICRGGDRQRRQSEEVNDVENISEVVQSLTGKHATAADDFGLELLAAFTTTRRHWTAEQKFNIVVDRTVGHEVGEVELERYILADSEDQITRTMQEMNSRVAEHWIDANGHLTKPLRVESSRHT
jgi:thiamine-triphosphatase